MNAHFGRKHQKQELNCAKAVQQNSSERTIDKVIFMFVRIVVKRKMKIE